MKYSLIKSAMASGLLLCGFAAFAQDRDDYHQQARDDAYWKGGHLFQKVREDLDHVQAATPTISTDEYRVVATKEALNRLQSKLDSNRYDKPELQKVISGVEKIMTNNHLSARDRAMLTEDVRRLHDFEVNHDAYGAKEDDAFTK